jgi:hypothetical protein
VRKRLGALDAQIQRIDMQIERLVDVSAEVADLDAVKAKLRTLREERARLSADRARTAGRIPTIEGLMPPCGSSSRSGGACGRATWRRAGSPWGPAGRGGCEGLRRWRIKGAAILNPELKHFTPRNSSKWG